MEPLGIHIEEEIDIAETLGGQDPGDDPDEGEPEEE